MSEVFQIKNTGNKCFVKMRAGKVLENRPISEGPFPDVPIKTEEQKEQMEDEKLDSQETDSDSVGFFEWD